MTAAPRDIFREAVFDRDGHKCVVCQAPAKDAHHDGDECEGYVVRVAGEIHAKDFRSKVGKYVRAGHVPVHGGHWKNRVVIPNGLKPR